MQSGAKQASSKWYTFYLLPNTLGSSSVCYDLAREVEVSQLQSTEQSVKPYELNNNVIKKKKRIFPKGLIKEAFFGS